MKKFAELNTTGELEKVFERVTRKLTAAEIAGLKMHPREEATDGPVVSYAKAVWRKLAAVSGVVFSEKPDGIMHHPV